MPCCYRGCESARSSAVGGSRSHLEDLGRLLVGHVVDLAFEPLGQGLDLLLARLEVVLGEDFVGLFGFGLFVGVAPDVP